MKRFTISLSVIIALFFFVASAYALDNGSKVPNFTLTDLSGKNVSLSDYKGKVVVLNFWASWCLPAKQKCLSSTKWIVSLRNQGTLFFWQSI